MKPVVEELRGARVRLRPLAESDLPLTRAWRNRDDVRCWFRTTDPISEEQHRAWWAAYLERDDDFVFVIEMPSDGDVGGGDVSGARPVGMLSIYAVDRRAGSAEFGRLLIGEPEASGRGLAAEATALLLEWAREALGLRRVELEVRSDNARAIGLYRGLGFAVVHDGDGWLHMLRTWDAPQAAA